MRTPFVVKFEIPCGKNLARLLEELASPLRDLVAMHLVLLHYLSQRLVAFSAAAWFFLVLFISVLPPRGGTPSSPQNR
jgi:hypothetical protein